VWSVWCGVGEGELAGKRNKYLGGGCVRAAGFYD
jgi:hypothetical protein